jgi:hypothetical protein
MQANGCEMLGISMLLRNKSAAGNNYSYSSDSPIKWSEIEREVYSQE